MHRNAPTCTAPQQRLRLKVMVIYNDPRGGSQHFPGAEAGVCRVLLFPLMEPQVSLRTMGKDCDRR